MWRPPFLFSYKRRMRGLILGGDYRHFLFESSSSWSSLIFIFLIFLGGFLVLPLSSPTLSSRGSTLVRLWLSMRSSFCRLAYVCSWFGVCVRLLVRSVVRALLSVFVVFVFACTCTPVFRVRHSTISSSPSSTSSCVCFLFLFPISLPSKQHTIYVIRLKSHIKKLQW